MADPSNEKNVVDQNQQMRAQKNQNRKDAATTEHHLPENEVDFELL